MAVASLKIESSLVLVAQLRNEHHLSMLQLLRLRVEASLPGDLAGETVPKPNVDVCDIVPIGKINLATAEDITTSVVSVHERPHVIVHLAVEYL